ncbi:hypothetical protein Aeqsu_1001 [Aequorivita sublithincola DSM 14238]|uniref:Uncharacterized protein n=1 Tax=Aequorivita sublithincola (strain DSM 14238 / LMG 21431 / ACAM 643 / 9-3) TaxID=746697 RepID=I3YU34_AEQSU|nr:hypothetical protein [Aequorivita sublithincola]AFL80502.1 hypothetical protein Aeqsu_1001 [Aequorivita sublithincola DSM 14238]
MKFNPYIYEPDQSLEVYKETETYFNENSEIKKQIEELGWIYHTVGMIIPQNFENFWSGHNFPFIESWEELQVSFTQICFGLYKQAFVSLRSGLELGMLSVYYNINDDGHNAVKEWLNSKENTPRADKIWKILRQNNNIKKFDVKHNLEQVHKDLGYLHNYVHTKGAKYSNRMGLLKSNSQSFEKKLISKWLKSYADIISLISSLHLLKYPISVVRFDYGKKFGIDIPSFGGLEEYNIDKIASILPHKYLEDIQIISQEDLTTQEIIQEIILLPDMTENQIEDQIIILEKSVIENGLGFTAWLENQESLLKLFGQSEFDERMKNRIEFLRNWSIENEFLESKAKRMGWEI